MARPSPLPLECHGDRMDGWAVLQGEPAKTPLVRCMHRCMPDQGVVVVLGSTHTTWTHKTPQLLLPVRQGCYCSPQGSIPALMCMAQHVVAPAELAPTQGRQARRWLLPLGRGPYVPAGHRVGLTVPLLGQKAPAGQVLQED